MEYTFISGVVRELRITKGYEDLAFTPTGKNLIGVAAIAAGSTGNAASSTILAMASNGAEIDMEFFTCVVDNLPVRGRFHKVDFKEGETIEFVVTVKDGIGDVCGARDPNQRFIWTLPYQTRGHVAQKKSDIISSLNISIICAILLSLLTLYRESRALADSWSSVRDSALIGFSLTLIVNLLSRRPFYKFSFEATKVFAAFGFEDPASVNLPKRHIPADKMYCKETGAPRSWDKPWRYRYEQAISNNDSRSGTDAS